MKKIFISFFVFCTALFASAQSLTPTVVATQGDYYTSAGGSISWTMGEIMTETYTAAGNILTQGFQQPSLLITAVQNIETPSNSSVYPNPFLDKMKVKVDMGGTLRVFNILGEDVGSWKLSVGENEIDLKNLANGIYIANIVFENNTMKSYKINKSE